MTEGGGPVLTVVSRSFAPQVSGSAILLANLLYSYSGKLGAVGGYNRYSNADPEFPLPCPTRQLSLPCTFPRVYDGLMRRAPALVSRSIRGRIRRALRKLEAEVVLAAFPTEDFLVAAFLAARDLRIPFYAYMHDLWAENRKEGTAAGRFAAEWEPIILRNATRVLCMTEAMQRHYQIKYGISTDLLPHCVSEKAFRSAPAGIRPPKMSKPTALFVGGVSASMNLDALKVLASASELLPADYELLFCTSWDLGTLDRAGIRSSRLRAKYVSRADVQRLQSEAHVLVAPLSHKNCCAEEVRTVFSTKLLEYLVSGRPIVVFGPGDSYQVESAKKNGWGYTVTEDSPTALAAAIVKVTTDQTLAALLVDRALREARARRAGYHADRLREWVLSDAARHVSFGTSSIVSGQSRVVAS